MNRSNFNIWGPLMVKRGRGSGIVAADASLAMQQLAYGEVLVLKLLPQCPTDKVRFWPSAKKLGSSVAIGQLRQHKDSALGTAIL
jgi:hypothetical protein